MMRDCPADTAPPPSATLLADSRPREADGNVSDPPRPHRPWLLVCALVLIALNLRPALSSLGPVLAEVVRGTGMSEATASWLTTGPVVCLGLFGLTGPALARRWGAERTIFGVLFVLAAGIGLRCVPSAFAQFAAALIAGAGMGVIGTLLPGLVKRDFPGHAALMTGAYTAALCGGGAAAAGTTVLLEHVFGGGSGLLGAASAGRGRGVGATGEARVGGGRRHRLGGARSVARPTGVAGDAVHGP